MIKKRSTTNDVHANVSLEPTAAASSTSNINNIIIINKREDGKEDIVITRDVETQTEPDEVEQDVRNIILEAYEQIILNQDKALIANIISKKCIIVPVVSLNNIIKAILHVNEIEVQLNEDVGCCAAKSNPIRKIDSIKIIGDNGEAVIDLKQAYNKEHNELVYNYHVCLKYCIV